MNPWVNKVRKATEFMKSTTIFSSLKTILTTNTYKNHLKFLICMNLKRIGKGGFQHFNYLQSVNAKLEIVEEYAFKNCYQLH